VVAHDRKSEQGAFPVFPVSAPVTRQFGARGFSFAVSMTFPVFGAPRRPVNRLYFFTMGLLRARSRALAAKGSFAWDF
jgi:hypothetical protein